MTGKEKCFILSEIRKKIAEVNGFEYKPLECFERGECDGTCARAEAMRLAFDDEIIGIVSMGREVNLGELSLDGLVDDLLAYRSTDTDIVDEPDDENYDDDDDDDYDDEDDDF